MGKNDTSANLERRVFGNTRKVEQRTIYFTKATIWKSRQLSPQRVSDADIFWRQHLFCSRTTRFGCFENCRIFQQIFSFFKLFFHSTKGNKFLLFSGNKRLSHVLKFSNTEFFERSWNLEHSRLFRTQPMSLCEIHSLSFIRTIL